MNGPAFGKLHDGIRDICYDGIVVATLSSMKGDYATFSSTEMWKALRPFEAEAVTRFIRNMYREVGA